MNTLPPELWHMVFDHLEPADICTLHTIKPFHELLEESIDSFWSPLVAQIAHYPSTLHTHRSSKAALMNLAGNRTYSVTQKAVSHLETTASIPFDDADMSLEDLKADGGYSHACLNGDTVYMLFSELGPAVRIFKHSADGSTATVEVPHVFEKDLLVKDEDPCDELDRQYEMECLGHNSELTFVRQKYFVSGETNHFYVDWTSGKLRQLDLRRKDKSELDLASYMQCSNGQLFVLDGHALRNTNTQTVVPVQFDARLGQPEFAHATSRYLVVRQNTRLFHVDTVQRTVSC
ncbi:hypothetical protein CJU89_6853 [Yarrowia sp. B02]|nr:hypothetical protein CJU89_6853 [Yarrowia sp. B02]